MTFENILVEKSGQVATIIVNRPSKLNALNKATIEELHQAFFEAQEDAETRVVIITGSGEKAFVAGADIREFSDFTPEQGKELAAGGHKKLFNFIENLRKPVIAAINGFALGGGLELAMAAHFRIASDNAKMGLPEVSLGVIPGYGGTQRLAQLVGKGRAMEMILTAGMIDSRQALEYHLVNHVTTLEELLPFAERLAGKIASNSPMAISEVIAAVNTGFNFSREGLQEEIEAFGRCFGTEDFKEGTAAFLGKRKAEFSGQ